MSPWVLCKQIGIWDLRVLWSSQIKTAFKLHLEMFSTLYQTPNLLLLIYGVPLCDWYVTVVYHTNQEIPLRALWKNIEKHHINCAFGGTYNEISLTVSVVNVLSVQDPSAQYLCYQKNKQTKKLLRPQTESSFREFRQYVCCLLCWLWQVVKSWTLLGVCCSSISSTSSDGDWK